MGWFSLPVEHNVSVTVLSTQDELIRYFLKLDDWLSRQGFVILCRCCEEDGINFLSQRLLKQACFGLTVGPSAQYAPYQATAAVRVLTHYVRLPGLLGIKQTWRNPD
jgi:hypothetical protein